MPVHPLRASSWIRISARLTRSSYAAMSQTTTASRIERAYLISKATERAATVHRTPSTVTSSVG